MTLEEAVKRDLDKSLEEWAKYIFLLGYETAKKEIIHCKDCRFYEPESYQCTMVIGTWFPEEYCNSSERKDNE